MATQGPQNAQKCENERSCSGYECEYVQLPPEYLQTECSVCLQVLRSPHITSCCGQNFCKECIERVQKAGDSCPRCNTTGFSLVYNHTHDVSLKQLEVYCTHRKIGCEWKGKLKMLNKHLNVDPMPKVEKQLEGCAFIEVQCWHDGCGQSLQRHLLDRHQSRECPQRPFSCEHCHSHESTYHDVTTQHWPVCKCYPVSCPHKCTRSTIERQNIQKHLNEACPLQKVECEFKYAGCETKLPRKDMPDHISSSKEMIRHMSLLAQQNQKLAQQNQELTARLAQQNQELTAQLDQQNRELTAKYEKLSLHILIAPIQITFTYFEQHRRDKDQWFSKGFYTHPQGYKICLRVDANGYGDGGGTHVSCYVYLMRGEFDSHLKWPFRSNVTVQLLNQREDNKHHTKTVYFNDEEPKEWNSRVTIGEMNAKGRGKHVFIPHSELGHTTTTNCQYLMNDSLYFQVRVGLATLE